MHKQHPQTAYRKYAILIGTIFENCDKSSTIREAVKLLSSKGIVEVQQSDEEAAPIQEENCVFCDTDFFRKSVSTDVQHR